MASQPLSGWRQICEKTKQEDLQRRSKFYENLEDVKIIEVMFNGFYGGFGFSDEALGMYKKETGQEYKEDREDLTMIKIVKRLGSKRASSQYSHIKIAKVIKDYWGFSEYDGLESVGFRTHHTVNIEKTIFNEKLTYEQRIKLIQESFTKKYQAENKYDKIPQEFRDGWEPLGTTD